MIIRFRRFDTKTKETMEKLLEAVSTDTTEWKIESEGFFIDYDSFKVCFTGKGCFDLEEAYKKGLLSRQDYSDIKSEFESIVTMAITPPRKQFEDAMLKDTEVRVSKKCYKEILCLVRFFRIPYKPIKEGIEIKYYPEKEFQSWKKEIR